MTPDDKQTIPNPIDVHVGARVRLRRTMLSLSQEKLGEAIGVTFQQVQKYEKGSNRIGASRLEAIARFLDVPVSFFFKDAPGMPEAEVKGPGFAEDLDALELVRMLRNPEMRELARAFTSISDPKVRKRILDLVRTLTGDTAGAR
jgi:transcriptional regulator with XRE-family HTH domain